MGAYALLAELQGGRGKLGPPTVYRALEFLLAHKLIHKIETSSAYIACCDIEHPHESQFMICEDCGATEEIRNDEIVESCAGSAKIGAMPWNGRSSRREDCVRLAVQPNGELHLTADHWLLPGNFRTGPDRAKRRRAAGQSRITRGVALAGDLVGVVMSLPANEIVIFRDLTLSYDNDPAVRHFSGSLARGSLTAIVGPNGAGKSTLLKGIVGLLRPAEGVIEHCRLGRGGIAYLPQYTEIERQFPISVIDTVLLGHWRKIGWARGATGDSAPQGDGRWSP